MQPRWAVRLCTLRGTVVWIDASWAVVLPFAVWSLAVGYLPEHYPVFDAVLDWVLGLAGAAGLFGAVCLHEAVHLLVQQSTANWRGGVVVHAFGGVWCEPRGTGARTAMWAIAAGPPASMVVGAVTFWLALNAGPVSRPLEALLGFLAIVNVLLAVLHCVPAWPCDAGRVVGCALVRCGVSSTLAARMTRASGALVAGGLLLLGSWQMIVLGSRLVGAWTVITGVLLASAIATHVRSSSLSAP